MDMKNIIHRVTAAGLKIGYRNDHITLGPRTKITSSIRQLVKANKSAITLAIKNAPVRLVHLAIDAGIHEQGLQFSSWEIRRLQGHDDLLDAINCSRAELQGWASALAIRATQRRGKVPSGWNQTAQCMHCGSVPAHHNQAVLSCGWCWLRGDK